jgi:phosphatidate cytidylyltransferase
VSGVLAGVDIPPVSAGKPLLKRVITSIVLIIVALAAVRFGGSAFTALIAAATLVMFAEWAVMHRLGRGIRLAGLALLAGVIFLTKLVTSGEVVMTLVAGALIIGLFAGGVGAGWNGVHDGARGGLFVSRRNGLNSVAGILYCGLPAVALIWLRGLTLGLEAVIFLLLCVWAADIIAFFTGRALGGPRLAPSISPNKTWSGAIGGVVGAMVIAGGAAAVWLSGVGGKGFGLFFGLAGALAVLSVLGDLLESGLKRRAGVKDSGTLLPGHGGVMDRLDGLVPVAIAGAGVFALTGWAG